MRLANIYHARLEWALRRTFPLWERLGLHVTPNHFYQPVPDTKVLPQRVGGLVKGVTGDHTPYPVVSSGTPNHRRGLDVA